LSLQEFIRLEAKALSIVQIKDHTMVWKAVECGAMEKVRIYAESVNYDVTLNELIGIIWAELCCHLDSTENTIEH
jgi:hypothetical protein